MPYIAFEGFECAGKTTFANLVRDILVKAGMKVMPVHQPGHTPMGASLRKIVKDETIDVMDQETIDLIMMADEMEMGAYLTMQVEANPSLWVIADRITQVSNLTYGIARKTPLAVIQQYLHRCATKYPRLIPDMTFFMQTFDLDMFKRRKAIRDGGEAVNDRFESESDEYLQKVMDMYSWWFSNPDFLGGKYRVIDATKHPEMILMEIVENLPMQSMGFAFDWRWILDTAMFADVVEKFEKEGDNDGEY